MHGEEGGLERRATDFGRDWVIDQIYRGLQVLNEKSATFATVDQIKSISDRMDNMVPRTEHSLRWRRDDERFDAINASIDTLKRGQELAAQNRMPKWFWGAVVAVATISGPVLVAIIELRAKVPN